MATAHMVWAPLGPDFTDEDGEYLTASGMSWVSAEPGWQVVDRTSDRAGEKDQVFLCPVHCDAVANGEQPVYPDDVAGG